MPTEIYQKILEYKNRLDSYFVLNLYNLVVEVGDNIFRIKSDRLDGMESI